LRRQRTKCTQREDFNKLQSETKETMNKKIYVMKKTEQDMKEELNKDMENHRKKKQIEILEIKSSLNQIKNTMECHHNRTSERQNVRAQRQNRY
jgi:hypothetical protein